MRRWVGVLFPILLLWTNPSLNEDGTVCTDLAFARVVATREVDPITITNDLPMEGFDTDAGVYWRRSGPGLPDQSEMTVPLRPRATDYWQFRVFAGDSSGNVSLPSNVVRVSLVSGGNPITGIAEGAGMAHANTEWYDVQGRRVEEPRASGVYFRRRGLNTEKVILLK